MRDMEAFLSSSQKNVTGTVEIGLAPYRFELLGIKSDFDLMQSALDRYGETNQSWSSSEVKAFTKIFSNQTKLFYGLKDA
jgi:argininosuccinate synthase